MSENITPDEFGWKLAAYEEVGEQSFGDGDTGEGVTLIFRNPTAPLALIMCVAEVIDKRERDDSTEAENNPEEYVSPYFVEERYEFVVFPDDEAMADFNYDNAWQEYVNGEGGYLMHETIDAAKREAVRMVQFARERPHMAFQWDGTAAGFRQS
jgi:hypothetical protein